MTLLTVGASSPNSTLVAKPDDPGLSQSKNLLLDRGGQAGSLPQPQIASGSLTSTVGKNQLNLINNNTGSKIAFLENPVSEVIKL